MLGINNKEHYVISTVYTFKILGSTYKQCKINMDTVNNKHTPKYLNTWYLRNIYINLNILNHRCKWIHQKKPETSIRHAHVSDVKLCRLPNESPNSYLCHKYMSITTERRVFIHCCQLPWCNRFYFRDQLWYTDYVNGA